MYMRYASVWTRFGALILDGLIMIPFYIPIWALSLKAARSGGEVEFSTLVIVLNVLVIIAAIVFGIWNTIVRMGKTGQSLGRKFLNIAVLDANGRPIGIGNACLREIIGRWVSGIVCYIGYLNAFWDPKNQMWHDKMASSYVYYVEDDFS